MSHSLGNVTALVTGATSGIGRATALLLAQSKANVLLVGRRQSVLEDVAVRCGPLASMHPCDITDDAKVDELAAMIQAKHGRLDVLVHSSGIINLGTTETASVANFDAQYAANVRGPYVLTQRMLPLLRAASGQVVVVNSSITRATNTAG